MIENKNSTDGTKRERLEMNFIFKNYELKTVIIIYFMTNTRQWEMNDKKQLIKCKLTQGNQDGVISIGYCITL